YRRDGTIDSVRDDALLDAPPEASADASDCRIHMVAAPVHPDHVGPDQLQTLRAEVGDQRLAEELQDGPERGLADVGLPGPAPVGPPVIDLGMGPEPLEEFGHGQEGRGGLWDLAGSLGAHEPGDELGVRLEALRRAVGAREIVLPAQVADPGAA